MSESGLDGEGSLSTPLSVVQSVSTEKKLILLLFLFREFKIFYPSTLMIIKNFLGVPLYLFVC